jgi:hypothetical protein
MLRKGAVPALAAIAALALASVSAANVPNEAMSVVTCYCVEDHETGWGHLYPNPTPPDECTIAPDGLGAWTPGNPATVKWVDDIMIDVTVNNHLGQPLAGSQVTVDAVLTDPANAGMIWDNDMLGVASPLYDDPEDPQTALSNAAGQAWFKYDEGGLGTALPAPPWNPWTIPSLTFSATMVGPGPGSAVVYCASALDVAGYDLSSNCVVDLVDLAKFGFSWPINHLQADFNHNGAVAVEDLAMFARNWGATCQTQ